MNPREFCKIAGMFAAQGEPAACRSAISRAYYSLFHVILEFLLSRNVPLPKKRAECHEKLYQLLYNSGSDILRTVGSELNDLRSRRNDADYRMDDKDVESPKTARAMVDRADRAIARFDDFVQDQAKIDSAVQGIKQYASIIQRLL